jgi:integrative and conjugative element protein (TIGR02256 family)
LWLAAPLLAEMTGQAERRSPDETGGMLLGWRAGADVVVAALVGAGPGAVHERGHFHPDGAWQQQRLQQAYLESGRTVTYLGDWHSHPRGRGRPSATDRKTAALIAAEPAARAPEALTLILARRWRRWRLHPYSFAQGDLRRIRLRAHD